MPQQVVTNPQIVIIGFMGTGKTTLAHELGRKLDCLVVDLDELITRRESRSPSEIIEQDGENEFRRIEAQLLCEVLKKNVRADYRGWWWRLDHCSESTADRRAWSNHRVVGRRF